MEKNVEEKAMALELLESERKTCLDKLMRRHSKNKRDQMGNISPLSRIIYHPFIFQPKGKTPNNFRFIVQLFIVITYLHLAFKCHNVRPNLKQMSFVVTWLYCYKVVRGSEANNISDRTGLFDPFCGESVLMRHINWMPCAVKNRIYI